MISHSLDVYKRQDQHCQKRQQCRYDFFKESPYYQKFPRRMPKRHASFPLFHLYSPPY